MKEVTVHNYIPPSACHPTELHFIGQVGEVNAFRGFIVA